MKRFFQVLLIVGIVITSFSVYLVNTNEIYAIFAAVFGVMIVSFSVFELVNIKKMGISNKPKPIVSKVKDDIEWTYYDETSKTTPTPVQEEYMKKDEIKFTLLSRLLSIFKIKHLKIDGKKIQEEIKEEVKKVISKEKPIDKKIDVKEKPIDVEEEKLNKLRAYITESLNNNISKEKIIESCNESGWPKDKVDKVFGEFSKPKEKNRFVGLYVLIGLTTILLFALVLTGNLLIGDWLLVLKSFNVWLFYGLIFVMVVSFGLVITDLKDKLLTKKKVHEVKVKKSVSEIKEEIAKKEIINIAPSNKGYETDIDKLLDLVNQKGKIGVDEIAGVFGISKIEAEEWGKILKDEELITLYYPTVGEVELRCKKKVSEEEV